MTANTTRNANIKRVALIQMSCSPDTRLNLDKAAERVTIRRRDPAAVEHFPAVTRIGPAAETIFDGVLPGMLSFQEGLEAALSETAAGEAVTSPGAAGVEAVSSCIGALIAAREGRAIDLPIEADSPEGRESWPIS